MEKDIFDDCLGAVVVFAVIGAGAVSSLFLLL